MVPVVDVGSDHPTEELFARRRVLLSGRLDGPTATRVCAELMALDGRSPDDVELVVTGDGGRLADVVPVLDVLAVMRARVHTTCIGRASGTAAVLLACGTGERRAAPHARISLRCDARERIEGSPDELRRRLAELELVRRQVLATLAGATGRSVAALERDLDEGGVMEPQEALAAGIIDSLHPA